LGDILSDLHERVLRLGVKILRCTAICEGVVKDLDRGIIPRVLFLEPFMAERINDSEKAKVAILGINPGIILPFEMWIYRKILDRCGCLGGSPEHECFRRAFEEIHGIWEECLGGWNLGDIKFHHLDYFRNTKKFLKFLYENGNILGIEKGDPILWAELVYCQSKRKKDTEIRGKAPLPASTLFECTSRYLKEVLELSDRILICLGIGGAGAYNYVVRLREQKKRKARRPGADEELQKLLKGKAIIGIPHPSRYDVCKDLEKDEVDEIMRKVREAVEEGKTTKIGQKQRQ